MRGASTPRCLAASILWSRCGQGAEERNGISAAPSGSGRAHDCHHQEGRQGETAPREKGRRGAPALPQITGQETGRKQAHPHHRVIEPERRPQVLAGNQVGYKGTETPLGESVVTSVGDNEGPDVPGAG